MSTLVPGYWTGDYFTADDGREFVIFSEHVRGDRRFYVAMIKVGDGNGLDGGWRQLPSGDGSYDKRVQRRRIERYVRETVE